MSTLEAIMECQRRKALVAKAHEEANSELAKDQNAGDSENNQASEMPSLPQLTVQVIQPLVRRRPWKVRKSWCPESVFGALSMINPKSLFLLGTFGHLTP